MSAPLKIKIIFILPTLKAGGAERVISFLAQNINKNQFETTLLVIGFEKDNSYNVENLNVVYLNNSRVIHAIYQLFNRINQNKPHIVMSSIGHVNILMGAFSILFPKIKFVAREASVSSAMQKFSAKKSKIPKWLVIYIYNKFDSIICQSLDMAIDLCEKYKIPKDNTIIINNPISSDIHSLSDTKSHKTKINFITIGRLSKEKGHFRILKVLSSFNKPFNYTIIGDGPEKALIIEEAKKLGIYDKIVHIPFTNKVEKFLSENDYFLQGSFVEGFPNALLESCAVGTPVLAFDAPGGTKEIIEIGINGYIAVNEVDYLSKLHLISEREWNPEVVRQSVIKKFNKIKIVKQYEDLFTSLVKE